MAVERTELRLVWPADLFAAEAQALLDSNCSAEEMRWLLTEALADDRGARLFDEAGPAWGAFEVHADDPWATEQPGQHETSALRLVKELIRDANQLPRHEPRRYWSARRRPVAPSQPLTAAQARAAYAELVGNLAATGYFDDAFGPSCPDARHNHDGQGQQRLAELLQSEVPLWPLRQPLGPLGEVVCIEQQWSQDLFYDVIEAMHDLVARPRRRSWHDFHDDWDYDDFTRATGQAVYRWRVNQLLARSALDLRLAADGDDVGLLVHTVGDHRDELVAAVLATPNPEDKAEVVHAVRLFRSRAATREDKRSAAVALARVLEDRRGLLKVELLSRDEGALFQIANQFDVRHRRADQHPDYDDAYLDWVFWWYLATVELTNRLLARQP
jgi:hypothetical protein